VEEAEDVVDLEDEVDRVDVEDFAVVEGAVEEDVEDFAVVEGAVDAVVEEVEEDPLEILSRNIDTKEYFFTKKEKMIIWLHFPRRLEKVFMAKNESAQKTREPHRLIK